MGKTVHTEAVRDLFEAILTLEDVLLKILEKIQ